MADRLNHIAAAGDADRWMEEGVSANPLIVKLAKMRGSLPLLAPRESLKP